MAAITIAAEVDVVLTRGVNSLAVAARSLRRGLFIQHQGEGRVWIKLTGVASKGDGIRLGSWERIDLSSGVDGFPPGGGDFYEGEVNAFFEGGGDATEQGGGGVDQTVLHIIEVT